MSSFSNACLQQDTGTGGKDSDSWQQSSIPQIELL